MWWGGGSREVVSAGEEEDLSTWLRWSPTTLSLIYRTNEVWEGAEYGELQFP